MTVDSPTYYHWLRTACSHTARQQMKIALRASVEREPRATHVFVPGSGPLGPYIHMYVKYIEVSQTLCFRRFSRRQTHNKFALTPLQIDMYIYICKYIGKVWPLDQRKISPILHVPVPGQLERGTRERSSSTFPISRAEAPHHTRRQNITNPTNMPFPVDSHHRPLI